MSIKIRNSKKAKSLKIVVKPGGEAVLVKPWFVSEKKALSFLKDKEEWLKKSIKKQKKVKSSILASSRNAYLQNKEKARKYVKSRIKHFSSIYKLAPKNISIKNQKTRWGSCSSKGNLSFNWQIIKLSKHLADYIIVHEICHLKEMNHSKGFWDLVSKTVPRYKKIRKEIRETNLNLS